MDAYRENDCRGDCLQWGGVGIDWAGDWLRPARNAKLFQLAPAVRFFEGRRFYALQYVVHDGSQISYPIAGLVWEKEGGEIQTVYVLPELRGGGIAKDLLAVARACVGPVCHSSNCTAAGAAWAAKVG